MDKGWIGLGGKYGMGWDKMRSEGKNKIWGEIAFGGKIDLVWGEIEYEGEMR